jgi:nicotinamidase-related amidase
MSNRIWDRFLTESDKAHLALGRDRRVGFGSRPALLLVDLYRAVFGDKPEPLLEAIKTWPSSCGLVGWQALPRIQNVLIAAREAKIPIVHITMLSDSGMAGWYEAAHRDTSAHSLLSAEAQERRRRSAEIMDGVKPIAGEVVLKKTAPSAFFGTPLASHLTLHGIDTLIVCGEATSGCVRASVVDAAAFRYRVQVVEDGVFDRHEATHALNLFDMHQKYADVRSSDEIIGHLKTFS